MPHGRLVRLARHPMLLLAILVSAVGCTGSWRWTDPDTHVVDGFYVGRERPCPLVAPAPTFRPQTERAELSLCVGAVTTAAADLATREPTARIVAAAMASIPTSWVSSDGAQHSMAYGGLAQPMFVVLTLASGERHAVPLLCMGANDQDGSEQPQPASCQRSDGGLWRVGAPPPPVSL